MIDKGCMLGSTRLTLTQTITLGHYMVEVLLWAICQIHAWDVISISRLRRYYLFISVKKARHTKIESKLLLLLKHNHIIRTQVSFLKMIDAHTILA